MGISEILSAIEADAIVTDCASCASFLKDYSRLLKGTDDENSSGAFAVRVRGFSQWLDEIGFENSSSLFKGIVTFHDPCHLCRYQNIREQPRRLLKQIPETEFVEMRESDWCCGAAGTYNIFHHDQSMRILDRKMDNLARSAARAIATECPGCFIQVSCGVRKHGLPVKVFHISQLLDPLRKG